ncbi:hypothetical protein HMPREF1624_04113 [Sporothrix schenckii ATCC 58251]|uniref:C2H2-type domain-containing protein n=1 Tax=Sporothrix schenckii (strain ATCC 58251 / de Perez 2211183) TaxID=1391915 RepID=U7PWT8_SPOS1|nr:hypothetical protein HMPREF1624_04113 [Sporothrix schenckii ATCC 58251]
MTSLIASPSTGSRHPETNKPPSRLAVVSRTKPSADGSKSKTIPQTKTSTTQEPTPPHLKLDEEQERERGRHRSRSHGSHDKEESVSDTLGDGDGEANGDHGDHNENADNADNSSNSDGPARKRRRSRKGLDKKFECPHSGCGKSYSRAEHLHRHQLNHTPKQIYMCDFPGCERHFVRLDLCNRHRDRHTAKGSSLNRKDPLPGLSSPAPQEPRTPFVGGPGSTSPESLRPRRPAAPAGHKIQTSGGPMDLSPSAFNNSMPFSPLSGTPTGSYSNGFPPAPGGGDYTHTQAHTAQDHQNAIYGNHNHGAQTPSTLQRLRPTYQSPAIPQRPASTQNSDMYDAMSPTIPLAQPHQPSHSHSAGGFHNNNHPAATPQTSVFVATQNFPAFDLPPSNFPTTTTTTTTTTAPIRPSPARRHTRRPPPHYSAAHGDYDAMPAQSGSEMMMLDQMSMPNTMTMFGADVLQKSPHVGILPDDFMFYLFHNTPTEGSPMLNYQNAYGDVPTRYGIAYPGNDISQQGYFPAAPQQVMSVTNLVDQDLPGSSFLSEEKSQELFELIKERFHENGHTPIGRRNDLITDGDRSNDSHMLSRHMMQAYIVSYWVHFSDQVPILHKPTFSPDLAPDLLLIAIIIIGAACLDKSHNQETIKAGAELSNFLAWHLRWELFMDPNFRPPAKLWVFQTLLLLELYEKMFSTRELHERAHIHHATTITLMRRGRSLIGKTAAESPPNPRVDGSDKDHTSRHSSTSGGIYTQDQWWNNWITNEATRRTAFAAFVIDSIHGTMFGHSTVMVAHEMRLPLPCDDRLWKATSGMDVTRAEAQLASEGTRSIAFLEGIKKTLSGAEVKTNAFGRTILMAGLLSVAWHMHQRDLQVHSLGGSQGLGGRDKWRGTLNRAFDSWKGDYDKSLQRRDSSGQVVDPYAYSSGGAGGDSDSDVNVVFESRVVLHHLAHMATHVDVVDLQVYARAKRLLGRAIANPDLATVKRRMKDIWAPTAKARDATFYAIQFLCSVLLRNEGNSPLQVAATVNGGGGGGVSTPAAVSESEESTYSARDDVLLNRPWVLYFAALVVWSYGYAVEGASPSTPVPSTWADQVREMREYLHRFGSIASPEDLKAQRGMNQNTSLLLVLQTTFSRARWELLHEGAALLGNCIQLNMGQME